MLNAVDNAILGSPTAVTVTVRPSDQRVDAQIAVRGKNGFVGKGVSNRSAKNQTQQTRARAGQHRAFRVRLDNSGQARNKAVVSAKDRPRGAKVRYYVGGRDITKAVGSDRGWKTRIDPGKTQKLRAVVRPGARMPAGSRVVTKLKATWRGDVDQVDAVKGVVRVRG